METYVVVLAGGAGTRFWPAGRRMRPKQLLPVAGGTTMLAQTLERCAPLAPPARTYIVTNEVQLSSTRRECPSVPPEQVLPEPAMRNTAAAIALAAERIRARAGDGVMAVVPADHVIRPLDLYVATMRAAIARAAGTDSLLTVGIRPTGPATGYGYIELGSKIDERDGHPIYRVQSFKEKPDAATAQAFLASGRYVWNSGAFVWRVRTFLDALARHLPGHSDVLRALAGYAAAAAEIPRAVYARFESIPVDIGILEKADNVEVVPGTFEWDDVGSWLAVGRLNPRDAEGNVVRGGRHIGLDTRNCIVMADGHLVATIGLENLIVVHTPDATLVCPKHRAEDVRQIVKLLEEKGLSDVL
ncbi:MAG: mannose-1-phosphate guanylyltransferase [Planctomycetaceae bacterium]